MHMHKHDFQPHPHILSTQTRYIAIAESKLKVNQHGTISVAIIPTVYAFKGQICSIFRLYS